MQLDIATYPFCQPNLQCLSGKCLEKNQICDGKYDCGNAQDQSDEKNCPASNVKVRLVNTKNRSQTNQGYIELKV